MKKIISVFLVAGCLILSHRVHGQQEVFINLARLDGIDITSDNFLNYQIQSNLSRNTKALIRGTIRYRQSDLRITYEFPYTLSPGVNLFSGNMINPRLSYSSTALKELFEIHRKLPEGIYEYCVSVQIDYQNAEAGPPVIIDECLYHKSTDIFLINLIDPPDDAKLYEYNPMLSWTVNYPFAGALTYRLRVAEIKEGQNTVAAITRNNPVFSQKDLSQLSLMYPLYAKPLVKDQPYAWTVDAYYKGILLGGAEPWKFTIIEDSLLSKIPSDQSYYEFADHSGETSIYAIDTLKLKYRTYIENDTLNLVLKDEKSKAVKLRPSAYAMSGGINYVDIEFEGRLKHTKHYTMVIKNSKGDEFVVPFIYINPIYLKK